MTIASEILKLNTNLQNSYTAISSKGGTLPAHQNFDNLSTAISSIPGSSSKYTLLQRIKDDNNVEIGSVSGFFKDENDVEYAIVCLDAQYRSTGERWCSSATVVTNLPTYSNWDVWKSKETATFNTQKILDYCNDNSYSSSACSHCRALSFDIDGVTYYGQLPNIQELCDICKKSDQLNTLDTSSSDYSSLFFANQNAWSSNQFDAQPAWAARANGTMNSYSKSNSLLIAPVLEIPNL